MEDGTATAQPTDEDTRPLPQAWHRHLHPRRGGAPVSRQGIAKTVVATVRRYVEEAGPALDAFLAARHGDLDLTERARRHLTGEADPAGAAAVALVADAAVAHGGRPVVLRTFADSWVREHGPAFAACATVELGSMRADRKAGGGWRGMWIGVEYRPEQSLRTAGIEPGVCARRIRGLLAVAGDPDYEEAVRRLGALRSDEGRRLLVSYLVPTVHDWVAASCAEAPRLHSRDDTPLTLLLAVGTADHLDLLGDRAVLGWGDCTTEVLATVVDGLGVAALPLLTRSLDRDRLGGDDRERLLEALARLPSDEAFRALLDRSSRTDVRARLLEAMNRFPVRAVGLLGRAAAGRSRIAGLASDLLEGHLRTHPEAATAALARLPARDRPIVESLSRAAVRLPAAPADALPPLLVEPPWTRRRTARGPMVIEGLTATGGPGLHWVEGERERWAVPAAPPWGQGYGAGTDWETVIKTLRNGELADDEIPHLISDGPEELIRPLLSEWEGFERWYVEDVPWLRSIVGRYGVAALPLALRAARANPASFTGLLLPYLDTEVAALMAGRLARVKSARQAAITWFGRHGVAAAGRLLPAALGAPGAGRGPAEAALRLVAADFGADPIVAAARVHGDAAADAVSALLAVDPLDVLPARPPKCPGWADPDGLPQIRLRGPERAPRALPAEATRHLVTMLAMSRPGGVYAGIDVVRERCDPGSLARFCWALFRRWEQAGAPAKDGWALTQLAWTGDDETVRRLGQVIRDWPGEGGHRKAVNALDVLADIGTDPALTQLSQIAETVKHKGLRTRAREKVREVATRLSLTPDRLADRTVPDFGLGTNGTVTLDYGPRRFVVGFDERLTPYVTDEAGRRRAGLPKPGPGDDPDLAATARTRFTALKKDVRTVSGAQLRRLESAMVRRRRWTVAEFRNLFVCHPLTWHITRRLVWLSEDDGAVTAFRPAEDRTLADVHDGALILPESASVGIAHPVDLRDDLNMWSELLADYEILQPFPQLGREIHVLTDRERAGGRLERFEGLTVSTTAVLALTRRGWECEGAASVDTDARWISRAVADGRYVVIGLDPGIQAGHPADDPEQTLDRVWIADRPAAPRPGTGTGTRTPHTFGELDRVTASEILRDLTTLVPPAAP